MTNSQSPVTLASFRHEMQAGALINELRRHGIEAQSIGETVSGCRVEVPADVAVIVPANQLERAKQLLSGLTGEMEGIDWSQVDTGDTTDPETDLEFQVPASRDRIMLLSLVLGVVVTALWVVTLLFLRR